MDFENELVLESFFRYSLWARKAQTGENASRKYLAVLKAVYKRYYLSSNLQDL